MVTIDNFRKLALSFPETAEAPHFDRTAFRTPRRIFATMQAENSLVNVKFSLVDQDVFCRINSEIIYPVPNKWGLQGWTQINLKKISAKLLRDVLQTAYREGLR
jgi:hypothetical protein